MNEEKHTLGATTLPIADHTVAPLQVYSELRQTAQHLSKLVEDNFKVVEWIDYEGRNVNFKTAVERSEIVSRNAHTFASEGSNAGRMFSLQLQF